MQTEAPPPAVLAHGIASRLREALDRNRASGLRPDSARKAAAAAHLSPNTVANVLNGAVWPDIDTIARLEQVLRTDLWGHEHRNGDDRVD